MKDNDPLLFINTPIKMNKSKRQNSFSSDRYERNNDFIKPIFKEENKKNDNLDIVMRIIDSIKPLYKNKMVLLSVSDQNNKYEGSVLEIGEDYITIQTLNENINFLISSISDINLLKIKWSHMDFTFSLALCYINWI